MAHIITKNSNLEAWQEACLFLKHNGKRYFNLILEINNPTDFTNLEDWVSDRNPLDFGGLDNISDVINTIFPYKFFERNNFVDSAAFYQRYELLYLRGKKIRPRQSWGTYFQRLLNFSKHFEDPFGVNQLENSIKALNRASTQRSSIVFHLSSSNIDKSNTRLRGAPCWHFGELLCDNRTNTIDFLVVYRNHDYFNKTLGNLIGLSKLLGFLCTQSGKNPGKLIVHSANAFYDCRDTIIDQISL